MIPLSNPFLCIMCFNSVSLKAFKSLFHNKSQRNGYFPPQNVWLYKGDKYKASPRFPSVFWGIINWIIFDFINFSLPLQLPNYSPYLSLSLPLSVPFMAQFLSIFPYISGFFFFYLFSIVLSLSFSLSLFLRYFSDTQCISNDFWSHYVCQCLDLPKTKSRIKKKFEKLSEG